ncbi:MAG: hypothetical protein ABSD70_16725 [Terracidiphilus sp.]|jgi:uncharacterized delta-60 repeat protein
MRRPICFKISLLTAAVLAVGLTSAQGANTAGTLDETFGNGGTVAATLVPVANDSSDAVPEAIRFQSNGDILVLVDVTITGANASATTQVLRYTPAGVLDTTFGDKGIAVLPNSFTGSAMAIDASNRVLIAGDMVSTSDLAAARLTANGILDTTFGSDGIAATSQSCCDAAGALVIEPAAVGADANDILFCGGLFPTGRKQPSTTLLARWTPSGNLDSTFGSGGVVHVVGPGGCTAEAVLATGEILDANGTTAQFEANGTLESSVNGGTVVASAATRFLGTTVFQSNGDFVVAQPLFVGEESRAHNASTEVLRFTETGAADSSFTDPSFHFEGSGGYGIEALPAAVAVAPNGDIVVIGEQITYAQSGETLVNGLARLTPGGDLDSTFGSGGVETNTVPSTAEGFALAAIDSQNRIIAVGIAKSYTQIFLSRYLGE